MPATPTRMASFEPSTPPAAPAREMATAGIAAPAAAALLRNARRVMRCMMGSFRLGLSGRVCEALHPEVPVVDRLLVGIVLEADVAAERPPGRIDEPVHELPVEAHLVGAADAADLVAVP